MSKKSKKPVGPLPLLPVHPLDFERAFHDSIAESVDASMPPVEAIQVGDDRYELADNPLTRMMRAFSKRYPNHNECVSATIRADQILRMLGFGQLKTYQVEYDRNNLGVHPAMIRAAAEAHMKKMGRFVHFDTKDLFAKAKKWAEIIGPVEVPKMS